MFECQYKSVQYLFLIFSLNIHKTGANDEYIEKIKEKKQKQLIHFIWRMDIKSKSEDK